MGKKVTVLIRVAYVVDLPEEEASSDHGILRHVMDYVSKNILHPIDGKDHLLRWISTTSLLLNPEISNCGQCAVCGQWTTDKEKPDSLEGLCNGATVDGKLLCDECLPPDHPWAF